MRTVESEAIELTASYMALDRHDEDAYVVRKERAKQYALIAADKVIAVLRLDDKCSSNQALVYWWLLVKDEIRKL